MKAFLSKYAYLILWILGILFVGGLFMIVIELNGRYLPLQSPRTDLRERSPGETRPTARAKHHAHHPEIKAGQSIDRTVAIPAPGYDRARYLQKPGDELRDLDPVEKHRDKREELLGGDAELGLARDRSEDIPTMSKLSAVAHREAAPARARRPRPSFGHPPPQYPS